MNDLRFLFSYLGPYKRDIVLSSFFVIVETSLELFIPILMANLVDYGVMTGNVEYMIAKGMQMGLLALLALTLGLLYARYAARAAYGWGARIRREEYRKIQGFSFSDIDSFETSSLVTRLTSDVTILQNGIIGGLRPLVRSPLLFIMGVLLAFYMDKELSVVFLVTAPLLGIALFSILHRIAPLFAYMQKAVDKINNAVEENVMAIRAVKAFVREEYEEVRFSKANDDLMKLGVKANGIALLNLPAFMIAMYSAVIAIMWFGGRKMLSGGLLVGELTGFLSYVMQVMNSMMMISNVFLLLSRSLASARRVCQVMYATPSVLEDEKPVESVRDGNIDFSSVSFRYSAKASEDTLSDITFHVSSGESVGILGATGSGKSTLVNLISRLYDVSGGTLKVGGLDVRRYSFSALRKGIGIVLQKNMLFSGTIRENMKWGNPDATDEEIWKALAIAEAASFVSAFPGGLDYDLGQGGVNVSGGQKQRLSIARTILTRPRILIFDDSLSAVDMETERRIRKNLSALEGTTKVIIAERLSSLSDVDKIIVLDNGKIDAVGTRKELMARSTIFRQIYSAQEKGGGRNA